MDELFSRVDGEIRALAIDPNENMITSLPKIVRLGGIINELARLRAEIDDLIRRVTTEVHKFSLLGHSIIVTPGAVEVIVPNTGEKINVRAKLVDELNHVLNTAELHYVRRIGQFAIYIPGLGMLTGGLINIIGLGDTEMIKAMRNKYHVVCQDPTHYDDTEMARECTFYHPGLGIDYYTVVLNFISKKSIICGNRAGDPVLLSQLLMHFIILGHMITEDRGEKWGSLTSAPYQ
jgi:hypothetical protein